MRNLIGLILILSAVAFILRVDFIFYLLYVVVALTVISRWLPGYRLRQLQARRTYTDHAFWGETIDITLDLENPTLLPIPWMTLAESVAIELSVNEPISTVLKMGAKEPLQLSYQVEPRRRGYYRLGPTRITSGDLFGMGPDRSIAIPAGYLTVYPRITPFHRLGLSSRLPFGTIAGREKLFEDPARPMGVRPYQRGDSVRQINWKVSARQRDLMVKTLQPAISLETMIILNLFRPDYTDYTRYRTMEWGIELAASLAAYLTTQKQGVGLLANGIDPLQEGGDGPQFDPHTGRLQRASTDEEMLVDPLPPKRGRPHLIKLLERLARVESSRQNHFVPWLIGYNIPLSWGGTAIVITPKADLELCQTLHRLVQRGINPLLLVTEPSQTMGQLKERARRLGFRAELATTAEELARVR